MKGSFDVLIVGIGGQGTILASNILGGACLIEGRHVKGAETHGMAQRGGSVESHIRIDGQYGPLIAPGTAEVIIAFDMLEALRYSYYLEKDGIIVVNRQLVVPTSVYMQGLPVPVIEEVRQRLAAQRICMIDADRLAVEAGSLLTQNIVMLGAASHFLPLKPESIAGAVSRLVPQKTLEINRKAFELGRKAGEQCNNPMQP
ncbi:MAG TPA: indolepyruvate oxidoreductase subunit beta [Methanoregulaceae archaeon]|nr:indolepyruvate oxidoreductase subunit beta [Methanoregulaceae archaeon]